MVSCWNKTGTVGVVSRAPGKVATEGQSQPLACGQRGLAQVTSSGRGRCSPSQDSPTFLMRVWPQPDPVYLLDPYFDLVFLILTALSSDQLPIACPILFHPCAYGGRGLSAWGVTRGRLGAPWTCSLPLTTQGCPSASNLWLLWNLFFLGLTRSWVGTVLPGGKMQGKGVDFCPFQFILSRAATGV